MSSFVRRANLRLILLAGTALFSISSYRAADAACLTSTLFMPPAPYTNTQCITPPVNNNGITATGSNYTVQNSGAITFSGTAIVPVTTGIQATTNGSSVGVNNSATLIGGGNVYGINASDTHSTTPTGAFTTSVTNSGQIILASPANTSQAAIGIVAVSQAFINIGNSGTINVNAPVGSGISAQVNEFVVANPNPTGIVTVNNTGNIVVTGGAAFAVQALSSGSVSATTQITNSGSMSINSINPVLQSDLIDARAEITSFNATPSLPGIARIDNSGSMTAAAGNAILFPDSGPIFRAQITFNNTGMVDGQFYDVANANLLRSINPFYVEPLVNLTNAGLLTISYPGAGLPQVVTGNYVQTSSGMLGLRINAAGQNDRLVVGGTAALSGGLIVNAQPGAYLPGTVYTIVTATGGVSGAFQSVTANSLPVFLHPTVTYDANDAYLNLGTPNFIPAALTFNQARVAAGLTNAASRNPGGVGGVIINALDNLTNAQAPAVFDSLSGAGIAATQNVAFDASRLFTSAMSDQGLYWREGGPDVNGISVGGAPSFYASVKKGPFDVVAPPPPPPPRTWRAWFTGFGQGERINGELPLGTSRQDNSIYGGAGGLDYQLFPNTLIGVAGGGSSGRFNVPNLATSGTVDGGHIGTYGVTTLGPFYAQSSSTFSIFRNHTTRNIIAFGGLPGEVERGDFNSHQWRSRLEFGDKFIWSDFAVTPFVAMEIAKLWSDGFAESGGILGLTAPSTSHVSAPAFAGARLEKAFILSNGWVFTPAVSAAWVHEFSPVRDLSAGLTFLPASAFVVDGARPASNAAQVKAGAKLALNPWAAVYANFEGEFSNKSQTYAGKGGVKVSW